MKTAWIYLLGLCLFVGTQLEASKINIDTTIDEIVNMVDAEFEDDDDAGTDQGMEEIITNAANSTKEFDFFYDENNKMLKVEQDMVFSMEEWAALNGNSSSRNKRTAAIKPGHQGAYRWYNNHIKYEYAPNTFSTYAIRQIQYAMRDWTRYTCLSFSQSHTGNRVRFQNAGGCFSRVGMVGGVQVVGLAGGCRYKHVVTHELGHAIGLHHEQTRPDRDSYVTIVPQNIPSSVRFNFQKYSWYDIMNLGIPYDYYSIMHYEGTAFSSNGGVTIRTRDPRYQNVIGRMHKLSFRDIKTVNIMYNCKRATRGCTLTDSQCPGEGFVGKDCKCWCSGNPYVHCGSTGGGGGKTKPKPTPRPKPKPTSKPKTGCYDRHQRCAYWSQHKQCSSNPNYMLVYCKKSCNVCGSTTTKVTRCTDNHVNCGWWSKLNYCNYGYYRYYMHTNCKRSCGLCSSRSASAQETVTTTTKSCYDTQSSCWYWARYGSCRSRHAFMAQYCKHSCGWCPTKTATSSGHQQSQSCVDSNAMCAGWAATGQCQINPNYMLTSCRKSCKVCKASASQASSAVTQNCQDSYSQCAGWAQSGECTKNPSYMVTYCKRSCNKC